MKRTTLLHCLVTTLLACGPALALRAADAPDPAPPPGRPTREVLREKLKDLTPEQRQKKLAELREKSGGKGPLSGISPEEMKRRRLELENLRESTKDLPLPERELKLREWREKNMPLRPQGPGTLTPEERETKRKDFLKTVEEQLALLTKKMADGTLTEEERRRLKNMEQVKQRLQSLESKSPDSRPPLGLPPPRPIEDKPAGPAETK